MVEGISWAKIALEANKIMKKNSNGILANWVLENRRTVGSCFINEFDADLGYSGKAETDADREDRSV